MGITCQSPKCVVFAEQPAALSHVYIGEEGLVLGRVGLGRRREGAS